MTIFCKMIFFATVKALFACFYAWFLSFKLFFLFIIAKSAIWYMTRFARFAVFLNVIICYIFLRFLLPKCKRNGVVISKLLWKESKAIAKVILSYIVYCLVTANWNYWISCLTLAKKKVVFFLYSKGFTIWE